MAMDTWSVLFHILNLVAGVFVIVCGIIILFSSGSFPGFIIGAFFTVFGFLIVLFQLVQFKVISHFCAFWFNFLGRGITYLLLGCLLLAPSDFLFMICGIVCLINAILYIGIWILQKCGNSTGLPFPPPFYSSAPTQYQQVKDVQMGGISANLAILMHIINIIVGVCILAIGVYALIEVHSFQSFVVAIYYIIFGFAIVALEFIFPPNLMGQILFYLHLMGRACFFLFLGCLIFGDEDFFLFAGVFTIAVSIMYCIFFGLDCAGAVKCGLPPPWCGGGAAASAAPAQQSAAGGAGTKSVGGAAASQDDTKHTKLNP